MSPANEETISEAHGLCLAVLNGREELRPRYYRKLAPLVRQLLFCRVVTAPTAERFTRAANGETDPFFLADVEHLADRCADMLMGEFAEVDDALFDFTYRLATR